MKTFIQFLSEATATMQAARLGLQPDGHGGWYTADGEFVAKTVNGELKFYNKRQRTPGQDPPQTDLEKNISDPNFQDPRITQQQNAQQLPPDQQAMAQQQLPQEPAPEEVPPQNFLPVEKTKGTLTVGFGRFNPPHLGHLQLMDIAAASAEQEGSDYMIIPSRIQDPKKNPLDPDTKISIMRQIFPQHSERIANDPNDVTIFDILKRAYNNGYTNVRIVCGADRVKKFDSLANGYNGNLYQFDNIEVVPSGDIDPDSDKLDGLSSSRMRLAAAENDFRTFRAGMPPEMRPRDVRAIFDLVRSSMGIQDDVDVQDSEDSVIEVWKIAPKYDIQTLRENYLREKIFKVGDVVEHMHTGLSGRIIRRGTNYLICVTEDNIMFKSWIEDVSESKQISSKKKSNNLIENVSETMDDKAWVRKIINKHRKGYRKNF